jgi:hypothetical protein
MNEERTRKCLRQVEKIRGNFGHRYSITVNQAMVATVKPSKWWLSIPASPAYGVYISQLIRYARASSNYSDFMKHHLHLRNRLLDQGYKKIRLIRSLKQFIFRYQDFVEIYSVSAEKIINDGFSYSENV